MGMGNDANADDGVGPFIISKLARKMQFFKTLDTGPMPENFPTKIASMKPSHVIILDAAMIDGPPGTIGLVDIEKIDEFIFTTHHIPLGRTVKRLKGLWPCEIIIIGIKPETLDIGEPMSPQVVRSAEALMKLLLEMDGKTQK